jgi:hypothetical protein
MKLKVEDINEIIYILYYIFKRNRDDKKDLETH